MAAMRPASGRTGFTTAFHPSHATTEAPAALAFFSASVKFLCAKIHGNPLQHSGNTPMLLADAQDLNGILVVEVPALRWVQTLTNRINAIVRLPSMRSGTRVTSAKAFPGRSEPCLNGRCLRWL
jgi:hypothetical protein